MAQRSDDKDAPVVTSTKFLRVTLILFVLLVYFFLILKTLVL